LFFGAIKTKVKEHTADQHGRGRAQAIPLRGWGWGTPSSSRLLIYILKKIKKITKSDFCNNYFCVYGHSTKYFSGILRDGS